MRASGLPSPVLKFAWQRRHTYIFELDIIGFTPGWLAGRAAVYSAWVWRSFSAPSAGVELEERRVAMVFALVTRLGERVAKTERPQWCNCPRISPFALATGQFKLTRYLQWPLQVLIFAGVFI